MVEHSLGKGGVVSPILTSGTIKKFPFLGAFFLCVSQGGLDSRGQRESEPIARETPQCGERAIAWRKGPIGTMGIYIRTSETIKKSPFLGDFFYAYHKV